MRLSEELYLSIKSIPRKIDVYKSNAIDVLKFKTMNGDMFFLLKHQFQSPHL